MRLSFVHPTGNPNSQQAALAMGEAGLLHEVITTLAIDPAHLQHGMVRLIPNGLQTRLISELGRRAWATPPGAQICRHPWRELGRLMLTRSGLAQHLGQKGHRLVDWLYLSLDRHVAAHHLDDIDGIYAYEDGAAATFQTAKQRGIRCFYDLPIMFYRCAQRIQGEEAELFPQLAESMAAVNEPTWKLERKEQEIELADHIFVASSVTRQSLLEAGVESERISVIPYGAPVDYFHFQPKPDTTFRALFVGLIGARKGVHYLLEAWKSLRLDKAELMLVGANQFPSTWLTPYQGDFVHIPSVPHQELNQYYSQGSVFVFPSLVEGFGMVLLEAMACGLPIITTPNTAGPDIITDGVEGFIVPIRDVEALQEKLMWCYEHPQELAEMGQAARRRAEQLTWQRYRQELAKRVQELLG